MRCRGNWSTHRHQFPVILGCAWEATFFTQTPCRGTTLCSVTTSRPDSAGSTTLTLRVALPPGTVALGDPIRCGRASRLDAADERENRQRNSARDITTR